MALGLTAAMVYTTYILSSAGIVQRVGPLLLSALVCTGAATTLTVAGVADGDLAPAAVSPTGFAWILGIAVVSTVGAITLFFAGLKSISPTSASILSTAEPVVTVLLAFLVFDESMGPGPARRRRAGGQRGLRPQRAAVAPRQEESQAWRSKLQPCGS